MAEQILKDPYNFDFLTLASPAKERELERGLLIHLRDLLPELGPGFAFVGSQVPLIVDEETFYIDLLFYHVRLHSYFVIELKIGAFTNHSKPRCPRLRTWKASSRSSARSLTNFVPRNCEVKRSHDG
jgi:predicted nuclease of restriction endonuclease-like (RecB) superfamily